MRKIDTLVLGLVLLAGVMGGCEVKSTPAVNAMGGEVAGRLNWGDQGDGTYRNPVLKADYSDPDVIRVGKDFYLIASDFHYVGMQVLHSTDLVNWQIVGQVFPKLTMSPKYDAMKGYGEGTWAPSLREHAGEFYIYVCTPHEGLFMWHAKNPAGPWSETVTVKSADLWEDPCPLWDADGQAYLVHSRLRAGPLILHKMSADGTKLLDEGKQIYWGPNAEGPKFYQRGGYYYISLPEGGFKVGWQTVLRSKNIYGPYEKRVVFNGMGEHQGGMVDLGNGKGWFIGFKEDGWQGRRAYLEPVTWGEDGWPVFGDGGHKVAGGAKPAVGEGSAPSRPEVSDDFRETALGPVWQWNHNPVNTAWSLTEAPGVLRLHALPAVPVDMIGYARNTLTQKLWDDYGVIDVTLGTSGMAEGQRAGLTFENGDEFAWVGVRVKEGVKRLVTVSSPPKGFVVKGHPTGKTAMRVAVKRVGPPAPGAMWVGPEVNGAVRVRGIYEKDGTGRFAYSVDGGAFQALPGKVVLRFADWKGARVGLFSFGAEGGAADFSGFRYRYFSAKADLEGAVK